LLLAGVLASELSALLLAGAHVPELSVLLLAARVCASTRPVAPTDGTRPTCKPHRCPAEIRRTVIPAEQTCMQVRYL